MDANSNRHILQEIDLTAEEEDEEIQQNTSGSITNTLPEPVASTSTGREQRNSPHSKFMYPGPHLMIIIDGMKAYNKQLKDEQTAIKNIMQECENVGNLAEKLYPRQHLLNSTRFDWSQLSREGYDNTNVLKLLSDGRYETLDKLGLEPDQVCMTCTCLPTDPVKCKNCKMLFCKTCLIRGLTYGHLCRRSGNRNGLCINGEVGKKIMEEIKQYKVRCEYGCKIGDEPRIFDYPEGDPHMLLLGACPNRKCKICGLFEYSNERLHNRSTGQMVPKTCLEENLRFICFLYARILYLESQKGTDSQYLERAVFKYRTDINQMDFEIKELFKQSKADKETIDVMTANYKRDEKIWKENLQSAKNELTLMEANYKTEANKRSIEKKKYNETIEELTRECESLAIECSRQTAEIMQLRKEVDNNKTYSLVGYPTDDNVSKDVEITYVNHYKYGLKEVEVSSKDKFQDIFDKIGQIFPDEMKPQDLEFMDLKSRIRSLDELVRRYARPIYAINLIPKNVHPRQMAIKFDVSSMEVKYDPKEISVQKKKFEPELKKKKI